jgi:S-adenosylmethionine hydrolase
VGVLKAVILSINPEAAIFDISHDVSAQGVEEGAFVLAQAIPYLPRGATCIAVVDPGVGTARRGIALRTPLATFVGPDNGLLSAALDPRGPGGAEPGVAATMPLPKGCEAVELLNSEYLLRPVSNTFHGRDIFAPVGAHLSLGRPLSSFGPAVHSLDAFPPWRARRRDDGTLVGRVIVVDGFGNLITDVRGEDLPGGRILIRVAGREFEGLQRTFQDGPEFAVYIGSSGFLEIGRRNASAAAALDLDAGASLQVLAVR